LQYIAVLHQCYENRESKDYANFDSLWQPSARFGRSADPPVMYDRLCSLAGRRAHALQPTNFTLP